MARSIISEGKTTAEAVEKGLKDLNVSKSQVEIKVLENEDKRSFFSILAPRIVKVELTVKEGVKSQEKIDNKEECRHVKEYKKADEKEIESAKMNIEQFLNDFSNSYSGINYVIKVEEDFIKIDINGDSSSNLIGYRGEVLNSLQTILNSIANKGLDTKIRVVLNIGNYKEKRERALVELADKISKTVSRTGKSVTLEPMVAYERKIIHNRLQTNKNVKTHSVGEEPYRKIVISKNN